jgi:hypothetical protein
MASFARCLALALVAAWMCAAQNAAATSASAAATDSAGSASVSSAKTAPAAATAAASCLGVSGTADGFDKETAVSRAQLALADYIKQYKAAKHLGSVTVTAQRAEPQPYWRPFVSDNMYYHPDIVTAKSYTICWQGVVSTYVCTSGAKICW